MKYDILPARQFQLYEKMKQQSWLQPFYLAGGTALALHLGHRESEDFDFFSQEDFSNDFLHAQLKKIGSFQRMSEAENTLHGSINQIKISFLGYKYPVLEDLVRNGFLNIAGVLDIACMKLSAIVGRGSKKDFIDLYFILQDFSLHELLSAYQNKYNISSYEYLILKSLTYFEDAENDPMPIMKNRINWEDVKEYLIREVKKIHFI